MVYFKYCDDNSCIVTLSVVGALLHFLLGPFSVQVLKGRTSSTSGIGIQHDFEENIRHKRNGVYICIGSFALNHLAYSKPV